MPEIDLDAGARRCYSARLARTGCALFSSFESVIDTDDRSPSSAAELHDNRGQVIVRPSLMNYSLQLIGRSLWILVLSQNARDLLVGHMPIYAVAAEQESSAIANGN